MIFNISIQEYARLAHLFRKALDDSSEELKRYPAFYFYPKGCCGDCSELLSWFFLEHNLPEPFYISGTKNINDTHAWLEINNTIIDITHGQFGTPPDVYIGNYGTSNTYLGYKITTRRFASKTDYGFNAYYLNEAYSIIKKHIAE